MNTPKQERPDYGFTIGLMAGTFVGAGLAMWLAPGSVSAIRKRLADSATSLGQQTSRTQQQTSGRVAGAVDELARRGQDVRNADAVAQRAHEFEQYAAAARRG